MKKNLGGTKVNRKTRSVSGGSFTSQGFFFREPSVFFICEPAKGSE